MASLARPEAFALGSNPALAPGGARSEGVRAYELCGMRLDCAQLLQSGSKPIPAAVRPAELSCGKTRPAGRLSAELNRKVFSLSAPVRNRSLPYALKQPAQKVAPGLQCPSTPVRTRRNAAGDHLGSRPVRPCTQSDPEPVKKVAWQGMVGHTVTLGDGRLKCRIRQSSCGWFVRHTTV